MDASLLPPAVDVETEWNLKKSRTEKQDFWTMC